MAVPFWQPGTLYNPGAVVQPTSNAGGVASAVANANFEDGDTGWTLGSGFTIENDAGFAFEGDWYMAMDAGTTEAGERSYSDDPKAVVPGQSITAQCYVQPRRNPPFQIAFGRVELEWLDENMAVISRSEGNTLTPSDHYKLSTVTATAPATAAFVRPAMWASRLSGTRAVLFDAFTWNYVTPPVASGLVFTAVQPDAGFSATTEPVWPTVNGQQVIDNEVVWEAFPGSRVVWEASPILVSGDTEPTWPESVDGAVVDNTIVWTAISRRVTDEKCPNTPYVAIAASKIFCGDDDIIAFSATVNPLDWSTAEDAGYLPFGLQTYGANPVRNLDLYRANLAAFNAEGCQVWQVDEDPANMALLDGVPVASTFYRTAQPLMNDLILLNPVGVRNLGVAGASTNLQAGGVGEPIDELVLAEIRAGLHTPHAIFVPAYGQYWLFFGDQVFVLTITGAKKMRWSRYEFPEAITDATILGQDLYLRTETHKVWKVDADMLEDDVDEYDMGVPFQGVLWWPYLDFGTLGVEKNMEGFDLVANAPEGLTVDFGYDQRNRALRTTAYEMEADTLPGQMVPMPVGGPSFDMRITFAPGQAWEWFASAIYIQDNVVGT